MTIRPRHRSPANVLVALIGGLGLAAAGCSPGASSTETESQTASAAVSNSPEHAHATGGETCFICDPSKREAGRLWCAEHSRYEDRCWICHPDLRDPDRLFCEEHGLYEDECVLCRGEAADRQRRAERARGGNAADHDGPGNEGLFCNEHGVPERECGICQPQLATSLRPGESLKVRLASGRSAEKAGVRTARPERARNRPGVSAFCEIQHDQNSLARITPLASGIVRRVHRDVGDEVEAGEPLVELHSAPVAVGKAALIAAAVDFRLRETAFQRERRLVEKQVSPERELQEAEAACRTAEAVLQTARQKLVNLGLTEEEVAAIEESRDASAQLVVRAPVSGTIVDRRAVAGEKVDPGHALFTVADLSTMWLDLSIPVDRVALLEEGLRVEAEFTSLPGLTVAAELVWLDSSVDRRSRMVRGRAVVPNPKGKLRAGLFGEARIFLPGSATALRLPEGAVQWLERRPYVFVKLEDDLYALRHVALGQKGDRAVNVVAGLDTDESVVVAGGFTVLSEFLKSRLGAGCVDD